MSSAWASTIARSWRCPAPIRWEGATGVRSSPTGWTSNPLKFDEYFRNLMTKDWVPRDWDGPLQYTDAQCIETMLPSDLALKEDPAFAVYASKYAADESLFFEDFKRPESSSVDAAGAGLD